MSAAVEDRVVRALGSISAATLLSRVLGYVRDMMVALAFGAGPVTDAFLVAFRIPNILRRLLGEGALSTAIVPVFTDYHVHQPRAEFLRMVRAVLAAALVVLTVVSLLGVLGAPWILRAIAPGFVDDPAQASLATLLTRVMFPYLLLVGLAALAMGALNAEGRFFASALGPALLNVGMIAGVLVLAPRLSTPILGLAFGVLIGGAAQLAVQIPSLRRAGVLVAPSGELRHPALRRVLHLLLPAVFGLAAAQVSVFVNTLLASLLPSGSISFLYYADRVMEFPLGVFGIALAAASLPSMSRQAAAGDHRGLARTLNFALRLSFHIALPATVGLILLRTPITRLLFERGRFGPEDTVATAQALLWYAVGLTAFSGARIAAQMFYALGEPGTAVRLGVLSVVANVVTAIALMRPMGHTALALASSVGAFVNLASLVWMARSRLGRIGGRALLASIGRTTVASAPLALWCGAALLLWPAPATRWREGAWLAATIAGGAAVFWVGSRIVARPEHTALARILPGRKAML